MFVPTGAVPCSYALKDLDTPKHDDDGRYQRGQRQQTLKGSEPHYTLRFPTPLCGLVDSLIGSQSGRRKRLNVVSRGTQSSFVISTISFGERREKRGDAWGQKS